MYYVMLHYNILHSLGDGGVGRAPSPIEYKSSTLPTTTTTTPTTTTTTPTTPTTTTTPWPAEDPPLACPDMWHDIL